MAGYYGAGPRPPGMPSPPPTNKYGKGTPPGWKSPFGLSSGYPVGPDGTVYSWDAWCVLYPHACPPDWKWKLGQPPMPPPTVLPPSVVPSPRRVPAPVARPVTPRPPAPRPAPPRRGPVTPRPAPPTYVPPPRPKPTPSPQPGPTLRPYQPPYIPPTRYPQPIPCGGGT